MIKTRMLFLFIFSCMILNFFILEAMEKQADMKLQEEAIQKTIKTLFNQLSLDKFIKEACGSANENLIGFHFCKGYLVQHAMIGIQIDQSECYCQPLELDLPIVAIYTRIGPIKFKTLIDLEEKLRRKINGYINEINKTYNNEKSQVFNKIKNQESPIKQVWKANMQQTDDSQEIPYSDIPDLDISEEEIK